MCINNRSNQHPRYLLFLVMRYVLNFIALYLGTTITQEMTYCIMTLDFDKAKTVDLDDRFPIIEFKGMLSFMFLFYL